MKLKLTYLFVIIFFFVSLAGVFPQITHADPPDQLDYQEVYSRAKVLEIVNQGPQQFQGSKSYEETLKVQFLEGNEKGKVVTIGYALDATFGKPELVEKGSTVVVDSKPDTTGKMIYSIYEPYRLNNLWFLLGGFVLLILVVVGKRGIGAIIGLAISILTITFYVIPQILNGQDPLTVCILGAIVILLVTTYIAHGISFKTTVALIGTSISLLVAALLSAFSAQLAFLLGITSENSYYLMAISTQHQINPQGLLLGGILIGTLGALNDITTTQSATVFALAKENPNQKISPLFWKSLHIGREHIISMINTLVLAYAGSSFAIFLFFAFNPANLPWWLILNDETTMEEIIRALVGSAALILAVPITTILASWVSLNRGKLFSKNFIPWSH